MFFERTDKTLNKWLMKDYVTENELYLLLHTLKGTAGSIGLEEIAGVIEEKLFVLSEDSYKPWPRAKWEFFLDPLIRLCEVGVIANQVPAAETSRAAEQGIGPHDLDKEFILLIDDDKEFITYTKDLLEKQGYSVMVATSGAKGLSLIYDIQPSFICIDIHLPDMNGFNILEGIFKKATKTFIPIAIVSADASIENRVRSYNLRALDFIAKPINADIFVAYIENRLSYKKEIEKLVLIDELTKVYNRKYMKEHLNLLIKKYVRQSYVFSLVILDLDLFKNINDTYGHLIGDEVLKMFCDTVNEVKREEDIFCRYGGEEFVLLLPGSEEEAAQLLMDRIRQKLSVTPFFTEKESFNVTFSAGIISINEDITHPQKMLELADQALYIAKETGRNRAVTYHTGLEMKKCPLDITIVIVDDDHVIRSMLKNFFVHWKPSEAYRMNVIDFEDGISFLSSDWYKPNGKYMILLDGMMPEMDGFEVLKEIRSKYNHKDILVSMLTARTGEEHVIKALDNGADDYIVKPFDTREVSARIIGLIKRVFTQKLTK
ncbi:diguanylate cyclase (GGDEF)-like protein [Bacillus ectoiniformans]|nr:diguanylate cyclase (GGDEF)-like protein [Bacillus ectoiniformans]